MNRIDFSSDSFSINLKSRGKNKKEIFDKVLQVKWNVKPPAYLNQRMWVRISCFVMSKKNSVERENE